MGSRLDGLMRSPYGVTLVAYVALSAAWGAQILVTFLPIAEQVRVADVLLALVSGPCLLFLPFLYILGLLLGWEKLDNRGPRRRGLAAVSAYSVIVGAIGLAVSRYGGELETGSGSNWLVTLGTAFGYGGHMFLFLAAGGAVLPLGLSLCLAGHRAVFRRRPSRPGDVK